MLNIHLRWRVDGANIGIISKICKDFDEKVQSGQNVMMSKCQNGFRVPDFIHNKNIYLIYILLWYFLTISKTILTS